jgi:nitrite reductase (cytochrome c-552)
MNALIDLIDDIRRSQTAKAPQQSSLAKAQDFQRRAQFWLDFVEAENSMGFHAPQEAARILAESINFSRLGQAALRP